ncbi:hypothetical protein EVAR_79101_1 [Eumeta japonica]|uniref:Uncharacterized protein n=1 Tax=Eumeta variegata TaxID=151549 RepID=A0A4C1X3Y9_EUMVA|nr:hypothetical protein EVAR_79101_1 [Eumeta japonica]
MIPCRMRSAKEGRKTVIPRTYNCKLVPDRYDDVDAEWFYTNSVGNEIETEDRGRDRGPGLRPRTWVETECRIGFRMKSVTEIEIKNSAVTRIESSARTAGGAVPMRSSHGPYRFVSPLAPV